MSVMVRKSYIVVIILLTALLIWGGPAADKALAGDRLEVTLDRVTFHSGKSHLMNIFATVRNGQGTALKGLEGSNFHITEDQEPYQGGIEAAPFVVTDRELGFVMMADNYENLAGSLTLIRRGMYDFLVEMGFRYHGAVIGYGGRPQVLAGPGKSASFLGAGVSKLQPVPEKPRFVDALMLGVDTLSQMESAAEGGLDRRVAVLLTEGRDDSSMFSLEAAAARIMESNTNLFVVGYGYQASPGLLKLSSLARRSGGAYFFASEPDEIRPLLYNISEILKNSYVLTCSPKYIQADGGSHGISIAVHADGQVGQGKLQFVSPALIKKDVRLMGGLGLVAVLALALTVFSLAGLRGRFFEDIRIRREIRAKNRRRPGWRRTESKASVWS